jgi:hypothetical protein
MQLYNLFRWLVDTMQYCDPDNTFFDMLPDLLQPHLVILGQYILSWMGCK